MKKKRSSKFRLAKELDFPEHALTGKGHVEITGNSECLVDGLNGILEYTSEKIKINLGSQIVTFRGSNLVINSFTRDGATVEGVIMSMEFSN